MPYDIQLDTQTHDLTTASRDLVLSDRLLYLEQRLRIRLQTIRGEWFLDTSVGIPYFEYVWVKNPKLSQIEAIFKDTILQTEGVLELTAFALSLDKKARSLKIDFSVNTIYGTTSISEAL